jgi:hypothetical protein
VARPDRKSYPLPNQKADGFVRRGWVGAYVTSYAAPQAGGRSRVLHVRKCDKRHPVPGTSEAAHKLQELVKGGAVVLVPVAEVRAGGKSGRPVPIEPRRPVEGA